MAFATDTFTGTAATELSAYSGVWSKQSGFSVDMYLGTSSGTFVLARSGAGVYQHSASPASADYSVFADITEDLAGWAFAAGVCGRMAAGAATFYVARQQNSVNELRLYKYVAGTPTQLGSSYANNMTAGVAQTFELRMLGTTISVHLNGGAAVISVTDSDISAAGKAGIYGEEMRESGVADRAKIDNFSGVDAGGGGTPQRYAGRRFTFASSGGFAS